MEWLGDAGLIAGGAAALGTILGALKKAGLIHLSTSNGNEKGPEGCPDLDCNRNVHDTSEKVKEIDRTLTGFRADVYGKFDDLNKSVSDLTGYIRGKLG